MSKHTTWPKGGPRLSAGRDPIGRRTTGNNRAPPRAYGEAGANVREARRDGAPYNPRRTYRPGQDDRTMFKTPPKPPEIK